MNEVPWPIFAILFAAGLAGSLHCIGMCGPIVVGFAQTFRDAELTVHGVPARRLTRTLMLDFIGYHVGRVWTYAVLGFVAGLVGHGIRAGGGFYGWQRGVSLVLAGAVVFSAAAMLGWLPRLKLNMRSGGCAGKRLAGARWFQSLVHGRGLTSRLLLGALMGFLPCGLVYANLLVASSLPQSWQAGLAMGCFGMGTVPSLTGVIAATRLAPRGWTTRLAPHAQTIAAVMLILTGSWMLVRAWNASPETGCPMCETAPDASAALPAEPGPLILSDHEPD